MISILFSSKHIAVLKLFKKPICNWLKFNHEINPKTKINRRKQNASTQQAKERIKSNNSNHYQQSNNQEQKRQVQSNTEQVFGRTNLKHQGENQTTADMELLRLAFRQSPQLMFDLIQAELYGRQQQQKQQQQQQQQASQLVTRRRGQRYARQAKQHEDSGWSAKKLVDSMWSRSHQQVPATTNQNVQASNAQQAQRQPQPQPPSASV